MLILKVGFTTSLRRLSRTIPISIPGTQFAKNGCDLEPSNTADPKQFPVTKLCTSTPRFVQLGEIDMWDVAEDGNCMFTSIQWLLRDKEPGHDSRELVTDWMLDNPMDSLVDSEMMQDLLSRTDYANATGKPLHEVRDPFVATWGEYVEYNKVPGVWAADLMQASLELFYKSRGYALRVWKPCTDDSVRLFEGDDERWQNFPHVLSRYSLLQMITPLPEAPPTNGFLDILHYEGLHFRALKTDGADILSLDDIVRAHNNHPSTTGLEMVPCRKRGRRRC